MSVSLDKASDRSPYGGHNSQTSYTKNPDGTVPEYVLSWRRYMAGGKVRQESAYFLRYNDLQWLSRFFAGRV